MLFNLLIFQRYFLTHPHVWSPVHQSCHRFLKALGSFWVHRNLLMTAKYMMSKLCFSHKIVRKIWGFWKRFLQFLLRVMFSISAKSLKKYPHRTLTTYNLNLALKAVRLLAGVISEQQGKSVSQLLATEVASLQELVCMPAMNLSLVEKYCKPLPEGWLTKVHISETPLSENSWKFHWRPFSTSTAYKAIPLPQLYPLAKKHASLPAPSPPSVLY